MILDNIEKPEDIKKLGDYELNELSKEVRDFIIKIVSDNGGHLASSLGVVELTIALLKTLNLDKDKIIWDVGHQSYAYKILTDRKNNFHTLRRFKGISGFPKKEESPYDSFNTGHSSTSISAGLGFSYANKLNNDDSIVVSVIGDGALTGGMAFEALNNCAKLNKNFIIILNDNEMSISENDGGINHALTGLRTSYRYNKLKIKVDKILNKVIFGKSLRKIIITFNKALKQIFVSNGMLFENLDIIYLGPIDGHNISAITKVLNKAKEIKKPCVIHIKTIKGKGYKFAEVNPTKFHGIAPFDIETGELKNKNKKETWTDIFSDEIVKEAKENKDIIAITAAMTEGTGLSEFKNLYPDRFFDVGICEQHATTFAAGLASNGKIPIVCIYSTFLQRAFDQIIHDVCLQNLHVVFMVDRAGLVGADGATHQGIFDIAFLKIMPNMTIMEPKNDIELREMIDFAINQVKGPVAIRYGRGECTKDFYEHNEKIILGKSEIIENEGDITLFALGSMLKLARDIRDSLKEKNIKAKLVNARFANPIDRELIKDICKDTKLFITLEEGVKYGSFGESVCSYINEHLENVKTDIIALPNCFIEQGEKNEIMKSLSLDKESLIRKIEKRYVK